MVTKLNLLPAIKRRRSRSMDASAEVADAALRARRPGVLARSRNTCAACGYQVRQEAHLDIHHLDDDHANNDESNLVAACHTCHPYQHIGEMAARADQWAQGLGAKTGLAHIPEISAADLNLLLRAIGAAMLDPEAREQAQQIYEELMTRTELTEQRLGAWKAQDFAAAMAQLTPEQYEHRHRVLGEERLMFSPKILEFLGEEFRKDYASLPTAAWADVARDFLKSIPAASSDAGGRRS